MSNALPFADRHIILTGASGGIGRICAKRLSELGARIIAIGRDEKKLQQLICELRPNTKNSHVYFVTDLRNAVQRQQMLVNIHRLNPAPNMLINMAGAGALALFDEQSTDQIESILRINVTATLLLTHDLLPLFKKQSSACIINVGSIFGSIGYPGYVSYCASKFALRGFSEALQRELADTGVVVKYFAPRATQTDFNSEQTKSINAALKNTVDSPEFVADQLIRFISDKRSSRFLGWPEKFFVLLNGVASSVVGNAIGKQLPVIKRFASSSLPKGDIQ